MAEPSGFDRDLVLRVLAALGFLVLVLALRGESSLGHPDFQVWRAADNIVSAGEDPYDADILNLELHENPDDYGDHWTVEGWETRRRMHLFNPPSWLVELRLLGLSAVSMTVVGLLLTYGAIVGLSLSHPTRSVLGYLGAATFLFVSGPADTTFSFGQTGLILCGLVGLGLVLAGRRSEGVAPALMSFKPHIALAAILPGLIRSGPRRRFELLAPTGALLLVTAAIYPSDLWRSWVGAVVDSDKPSGADDMSLRTLTSSVDLPAHFSTFTLVMALVASAMMTIRWTRADPALLRLAALAMTVYSSGHAFGHDWLWIVFIPVVGRWSPVRSLTVGIIAGAVYTVGDRIAEDGPALVNLKSVLGMAVAGFLVHQAWRSHARAESFDVETPAPAGALASPWR